MQAGSGPESVSVAYSQFLDQGVLGKPKEGARKKLGLEPLPATGGDVISRLVAACDDEGDE
jgi:hypothetical protein